MITSPSSRVTDAPVDRAAQRTRILSIQLNVLGIATVSRLMRQYFAESQTCWLDSRWWDEGREWPVRLMRRLLVLDDAILKDRAKRSWLRRRNLDLHRFRSDFGPSLHARRLVTRCLRQNSYDVLHFHPQSLGFASLGAMQLIPTVLQIDMTAVQLAHEGASPRWRWTFTANKTLDQRLFDAARFIVPYSEWARQSVLTDYSVDPQKVRIIFPGVDLSRFPSLTTPIKSPIKSQRPLNLLFAGYDFERKGGLDLLDVFLSRFADRAVLHLMTTQPPNCTHPNVFTYTNVTAYSDEWLRLFRDADVFVMPTRSDAMPNVLLEAMAMGLPVVSSRLNAIPEMVCHGETGFLITPGDREALASALETLLGDTALRHSMGRTGRAVVEAKFDMRTNIREWEAIFREAAGVATG